MGNPFDDLTKKLAQKELTRRESLRWIGGGFIGAALATLGFGKLMAGTSDHPTCPDYCRSLGLTPGNGNAFGKCVSNCANCRDAGGTACGAESCCFDSDVCSDGTCVTPCCETGNVCGTFEANCGGGSCFCYTTPEGGGACGPSMGCGELLDCSASSDCPDGWFCAVDSCCGRNVCIVDCDCEGGGAGKIAVPQPTHNQPTSTSPALNIK